MIYNCSLETKLNVHYFGTKEQTSGKHDATFKGTSGKISTENLMSLSSELREKGSTEQVLDKRGRIKATFSEGSPGSQT